MKDKIYFLFFLWQLFCAPILLGLAIIVVSKIKHRKEKMEFELQLIYDLLIQEFKKSDTIESPLGKEVQNLIMKLYVKKKLNYFDKTFITNIYNANIEHIINVMTILHNRLEAISKQLTANDRAMLVRIARDLLENKIDKDNYAHVKYLINLYHL